MTSDTPQIFFDRTGRRIWWMRATASLVAILATLLIIGFVGSLMAAPQLAQPLRRGVARIAPPHSRAYAQARRALLQRIAQDERATRRSPLAGANASIAGAYFPPWQDGALASFQAHASQLTHVYPTWLQIAPDGRSIVTTDWTPSATPTTRPLLATARNYGVRVAPVLANASHAHFDPVRVRRMLAARDHGQGVIEALVAFVSDNNLAGLQLDIEMLDPQMQPAYEAWVDRLAHALHARGKEISSALQAEENADAVRAIGRSVDYVVAMAYDENGSAGDPGPVGSASFVDGTLRRFSTLIPAQKIVLGIGAYGYDWTGKDEPEALTNAEAMARASGYRQGENPADVIDFDDRALEPTFQYRDDRNLQHEVWFLDGVTVANAATLARAYHTRGGALWALGMEDATTWSAFGRGAAPHPDLHTIVSPPTPQFIGDGELLTVRQTPSPGQRSYGVDAHSGLIDDESYQSYPTSWIVAREGDAPHLIALTFDDGPDPQWTPALLDVLRQAHVSATFFMIGENAVAYPDLVHRVYDAGHEIGNHSFTHPNMAHTGPERIRLELAACQRALESILHRSVRLFRPPYNADADPSSFGEIFPVSIANQAGYLTAGSSIDPQDWDLHVRDASGGERRLTADDIVASVLRQIDQGRSILLHDGGGDRSATVEAVRRLIPLLESRGYRFVTMGELANLSRATDMPALSAADWRVIGVDDAVFTAQRIASTLLFWGFSIAIVLGLARIALMIGLAARRLERPQGPPASRRVDVLIAAYNEEVVIADTIRSVLASEDVDLRVIVVDDGSTDATAQIATAAFAEDPRVLLLRKTNGGKASALNVALSHATAPVVIGVDADTQLDPKAASKLIAWFVDPHVGAVAGNVKVGNADNIITRWQSIEYITSQNIDRRALARVNAITVVPGAIGAWRLDAVRAAGGYGSDTLAEDMDLTWRLRRAGWRIANESGAAAYTEAPASMGALAKQRFRWTFGTLQCLWKHRDALGRYGWFGRLALPSLWLFQILLQVLAPLVDLQLLVALISHGLNWFAVLQHQDIAPSSDTGFWLVIAIYIAYLSLELAAAFVAYAMDRADKRTLALQPLQRLVYRQIMYWVAVRALVRAAIGVGQGWGKLRRTGAVKQNAAEPARS